MKIDDKASISVRKIILMALVFAIILGVTALASNVKINNVKIKFSNDHEITVMTSKTKVADILEENHIILEEDETVLPSLEDEITDSNKIIISKIGEEPVEIANVEEININTEQIVEDYTNITEKIITVIEEIPFETITKDVSNGSTLTTNQIIQAGQNGEKKVTYKVTYKNDVEISRQEISSEIIKEPVNKIVQIQTKAITSRTSSRVSGTSGQSGVYKVTAYCACAKCCGWSTGITASGARATANHTIAAPSTFAFGTKVVINGITYTVEDRGGAIQGNRIDVYMDSHTEALQWGVRYLYVEVLN
ncbi:MAG: G5 domain-containing protein [Clostridia bacterium]